MAVQIGAASERRALLRKVVLTPRALLFLPLLLLALACVGCSPGEGPTVSEIAAAPRSFVGSSIGMRVTPVFWTALRVRDDGSLGSATDADGWVAVCAVNPQRVTQGLLVCARDPAPLDTVRVRAAAAQRVDGVMKTFPRSDVVKAVKESQGVDLIVTSEGLPLYVEVAQPLATASALADQLAPRPVPARLRGVASSASPGTPSARTSSGAVPSSPSGDTTSIPTGDIP